MKNEVNRWWFSQQQKDHQLLSDRNSFCEVFVGGEWMEYTEWTSSIDIKSNYDDAILLAESYSKLPLRINGKELTIT